MTLQFLDLLDTEQVPQNSDVVLVLSQYESAMQQFREDHTHSEGYETEWDLEGGEDDDSEEDLDDD